MKKMIPFLISFLWLTNTYAADYNYHFMLTGASFGVVENGWFELSSKAFDAEAINKAVSGEAIYHTANRMAENTFYTTAELDRTDAFVIMHVHNQNVADPTWLKENYADYTMPTTNYAIAYDYVIKRYKDDCYKLKDDPTSKYYGTAEGKPAVIVLCTHWHDSRTTYNAAIRTLAQKWNLPLVEWDTNIGFTKNVLENGQQPSLQYAKDTETIYGVTYGWHPLRGQGQYIQKKIASIFNAAMEQIMGVLPVNADVSAKSDLILTGENAVVNVNFTGTPPWNLTYKVNGQTESQSNIYDNPLKLDFTIADGQSLKVEPVSVSNASIATGTVSGSATIRVADKTVSPFFDTYVHQTNKTTNYATDPFVMIKTSTDNYSRESYFTFDLENVKNTDEKIIFRAYFYQRVYPNSENILEDHVVEIDGNTNTYTTLTWNTKPTGMTKIGETLIVPSDMGNYINWDVTDWMKEQVAAGKTSATLCLKVIPGGVGLLYFYSVESADPNKPQLIIKSADVASEATPNRYDGVQIRQTANEITISADTQIQSVSVFSAVGKCAYSDKNIPAGNSFSINSSKFPAGVYLINTIVGDKNLTQKIVKQ